MVTGFGWSGKNKRKNKIYLYWNKFNYFNKKQIMGAQHLTQQEKAKLYDDMLMRYQRLQEQVRLIKAKSFEISEADQKQINILEATMKKLYNDTQKLF